MGNLKNRCVIIGGGDCSVEILNLNVTKNDYIICADSGYDIAKEANIYPDLLIGDFDSIKEIPNDVSIITLPVEKDVTDTVAAYNEGLKRGFNSFVLLGGTGGRFEHTFANISLMANASYDGNQFEIIDDKHIFRSITDSEIEIERKNNQQVSVIAYGSGAFGVTEKGFYYTLNDEVLSPFDVAQGVSNHIVDDYGIISVEMGTLIIIETQV